MRVGEGRRATEADDLLLPLSFVAAEGSCFPALLLLVAASLALGPGPGLRSLDQWIRASC
mgnify:CR=1 FL=1